MVCIRRKSSNNQSNSSVTAQPCRVESHMLNTEPAVTVGNKHPARDQLKVGSAVMNSLLIINEFTSLTCHDEATEDDWRSRRVNRKQKQFQTPCSNIWALNKMSWKKKRNPSPSRSCCSLAAATNHQTTVSHSLWVCRQTRNTVHTNNEARDGQQTVLGVEIWRKAAAKPPVVRYGPSGN